MRDPRRNLPLSLALGVGIVSVLYIACNFVYLNVLEGVLRAVEKVRRGQDPFEEGGVIGLFATEEQLRTLNKVQALMSLLEGHGNVVMDRIGAEHVSGQDRMSATLRARRQSGGAQRLFYRLTGVELKVQQYEQGEHFIRAVESEAGRRVLDRAWQSAESLPTLDEIRDPPSWLRRVA